MDAAIYVYRVVRSTSLYSVDSWNPSGTYQKGAFLCEMPQESWEISHFATCADGVRGISNTPLAIVQRKTKC